MADAADKLLAVQLAVTQEVEKSGRVFDPDKKVASDLHYGNDDMERLLQAVQIDLLTAYHYAYAKGDGAAAVDADDALSDLVLSINHKTT